MSLNELMQFDHVVYSDGEGNISEPEGVWAPEVHADTDADGQYTGTYYVSPDSWELLTGFTAQAGNSFLTEFMHSSEYIGGRLEKHIRETAGYFVAVTVEDDTENPSSWAVAYTESL